jgi:hypothetical protein
MECFKKRKTIEIDRRRHLRYDFNLTIEYVKDSGTISTIYKGIVIDISNSGLRLLTPNPLSVGQEIIIKSILPSYSQIAIVRWVENPDNASFNVGLEFQSD